MGRVRKGITINQANAQMAQQKAAKAIEAAGVVEAAAKPPTRKRKTPEYDFTGVNKDQMVAFCINHGINLPKSDTREALERVIKRFVAKFPKDKCKIAIDNFTCFTYYIKIS